MDFGQKIFFLKLILFWGLDFFKFSCPQCHPHPGLNDLTRLYNSLQSLASNEPLTKIRCRYSLDRRRGYFEESEFRASTIKPSNNLDWIRNTITQSTFALAYDENRFILMHSLNGRQSCIMTIWNSESELV